MSLKVTQTNLPGVIVIEPKVFGDERGFLLESYQQEKYREAGLADSFVQDNHSRSCRGVLRGLHYQLNNPQGKLIYVVRGEIFDVAVDIRRGSESFGRWFGAVLSEENHRQMYMPAGFAHGFCVLSEIADVTYKCTGFYTPGDDYEILWSDAEIGIDWPIDEPILSAKDSQAPRLSEAGENLPFYMD